MIRRVRKIRKMRGHRTMGYGSHKKHRGAGSRGGRGMAGGHKHKWSWIIKYDPEHFGKHGFQRPLKLIKAPAVINIGQLDQIAESLIQHGLAQRENDKIVIDITALNCAKVLGSGKVTKPLIVKAPEFSKLAIEKLEGIGGRAVILGEPDVVPKKP